MENKNEKIKCSVCFSGETDFLADKNGFKYYQCKGCGLIFLWPVPSSQEIYNWDYFKGADAGYGYVNYDEDKKAMIPAFNKYLDLIEKTTGHKGRLLDIGAATGFFMQLAKKRGWYTSGIEISEYAAKIGQQKGLDLKVGVLENVNFINGTFDVITMWDVIEHLPDPTITLLKIKELLVPGGFLAINTPDASSLWARLMKRRWQLLVPPEHIFLFSRNALVMMLQDNGFELMIVKKIGKSFSLPYVFSITHKWLGIRAFKKISTLCEKGFAGRISIPINLRDNIFVLAKKI